MYKIAIDGRFLLRTQRGMPLYVTMITSLLPKALTDCQFFILINSAFEHNDSADNYNERLAALSELDNVTIVDLTTDDEISWEMSLLPRWLSNQAVDLLHMPTNRVCLRTGTKQLVTLHDCMEWSFLSKIHAIPQDANLKLKLYFLRKRLYVWLIYKLGLRKAKRVLTISKCAQDSIVKTLPQTKSKIDYVYHGVPIGFEHLPELSSLIARKGVLMLGGDSYQKNPENAIRAWGKLPEQLKKKHPLNIAGFTGEDNSPIMKTLKELEIVDQVNIYKWVDDSTLIDLFQKSSVLLFASREEGFGFPLIQAFACGTPVVTSEADVLREIGGDCALTAPAEQPDLLSKRIEEILLCPDQWLKLHKLSLNRAKSFTWDITTKHIAKTYIETINNE